MSSAQSRPTHRRNGRCNKCGSSNIQGIEMAYIQGVRHSESGYTSISEFSERIAPPEEKSLLAEPMFTAIGLAGATFLLSTLFGEHLPFLNPVSTDPMGKISIILPLIVAIVAFFWKLVAVIKHNVTIDAEAYERWRCQTVCRRCGHVARDKRLSWDSNEGADE